MIDYEKVILNYLRDSNIAKYQSIISDEEVLKSLLKRSVCFVVSSGNPTPQPHRFLLVSLTVQSFLPFRPLSNIRKVVYLQQHV